MFKHLPSTKSLSLFALPLLVLLGILFLSPTKVYAASLTVDSILDTSDSSAGDGVCDDGSGNCTLRAAIEEANALAGADNINFNITGSGVHTFTPGSSYDTISEELTIDGYSQLGSSANSAVSPNPFNGTLTIEIDGTSAGNSDGLDINSSDVTIMGLVVNRFEQHGISLDNVNNSNAIISGNYIGTDPTGLVDRGNGEYGINVNCCDVGNVVVGGTAAAARNIISGNQSFAILVNNNLTLQGNYIGLNASGTDVIPNLGGGFMANLLIQGSSNTIGGSSTGAANMIAGTPVGLSFFGTGASNNIIQGNYIGTNPSGNVQSGFGASIFGVSFFGGPQNNLLGGVNVGEGNIIAGNGAGVGTSSFQGVDSLNNSILGNSIHDNSGGTVTALGIDLMGNTNDGAAYSNAGVTANDAGDGDEYSNQLMNYPVVLSVSSSNGQATITYSLDINDSEAGASGYRVEFFANDEADPSGHGQGQTYLGSDTVAGDVTNRSAAIALPSGVSGSKYISATATMTDASDDGFGHTSEFAENVQATLVASGTSSSSLNSLADTGQNINPIILLSLLLITSGLAVTIYQRRRSHYL